ncbi:exonuclease SbcCD subunit D [Ligilactobacillus saerimneri]|uniref:exonuclease SbcCD subunit D n=1 Tax=Ligilactobacillus saerimneri TaxID=228229 RepID=UPI00242CFC27|nr:exonuclease SbcCD subunit D [Ligilactobacillus saerimneri]
MRFLHTADWHIGKRLGDFSLQVEQQDAFQKIVAIARQEQVDAVVIAGDLYDRSLASEESVQTVNGMLEYLNLHEHLPLLIISGNHDSAVRLSTGDKWMRQAGVHIVTDLEDAMKPIIIDDTQFFLLPYFEPYQARNFFADRTIKTTQDAVIKLVVQMQKMFDPTKKHVLVAHFFAANQAGSTQQSEAVVGGVDMVATGVLQPFDYVALGHIHNPQALTDEKIKYSGTPLMFSTGEITQTKGVRIIDTTPFNGQFIPLTPLHAIKKLTGTFADVTSFDQQAQVEKTDYVAVELTDQEPVMDAFNRLHAVYPRLFELTRRRIRRHPQQRNNASRYVHSEQLDPVVVLRDFYQYVTGQPLAPAQEKWALKVRQEVDDNETN